jgi:ribosomal protein S18 acetylase RimI-like enzyme
MTTTEPRRVTLRLAEIAAAEARDGKPPGLEIRRARRGDVEAIRLIQAEGWVAQRAAAGMPPPGASWLLEGDDPESVSARAAAIRAGIEAAGEGRWLVACTADGIVGYAVAAVAPDGTRSIAALYVSRRGTGVGGALLREALVVHAGHDVRLEVVDGDLRAARFYRRHGFRFTGAESAGMFTQVIDRPLPLRQMMRPAARLPWHDSRMSTSPGEQPDCVQSSVPDLGDLPLDAEIDAGDAEYARIMGRIAGDGGTATPVSAFNSSI